MLMYTSRAAAGMGGVMPSEKLWDKFLSCTDKYRNERLKVIPNVAKGPWIVKKLVGSQPSLLGQQVPVSYFGGASSNYLEISIDVSQGGRLANSIATACLGRSSEMTITLSFLVEGRQAQELPEQILLSITLHQLDMAKAPKFSKWEKLVRDKERQPPKPAPTKAPEVLDV